MQLAWWAVQARESLVCKQYGSTLRAAPQDDLFYQRLRSKQRRQDGAHGARQPQPAHQAAGGRVREDPAAAP